MNIGSIALVAAYIGSVPLVAIYVGEDEVEIDE